MALRATFPDVYIFIRDNKNYVLHTTESYINKDRSNKEAKDALEILLDKQERKAPLSELLAVMFPRFDEIMNRREGRKAASRSVCKSDQLPVAA
jgi:hypothetical protein